MLLRTKDRCGKSEREAGMYLETKEIGLKTGMLLKRKGHRWQVPANGCQVPGQGRVKVAERAAEPHWDVTFRGL